MPVNYIKDSLKVMLPQYNLISDCISGEVAVKAAREKYLPMPEGCRDTEEGMQRYENYLKRALFYNVTRRTMLGLLGTMFSKEYTLNIDSKLKPVISDATGEGVPFEQLVKQVASYVIAYSRAGVLVDFPETDGAVSVEDLTSGKIRPTLYAYTPNDIINWRTESYGSEEKLSLVVLDETYILSDDGFEIKEAKQYRVLRLVDGVYVTEIWRKDSNRVDYGMVSRFIPTDSNGLPFDTIPFVFIGGVNNDSSIDNPNLYDIAAVNIAHYRNSADYEESCFIVGQPTPVLTGLTEDWVEEVLDSKISFGSRGGIMLPVGGDAKLLQAQPNSMAFEAMGHKEKQMVALGARLVDSKTVEKTATEVTIDNSTQISTLATIAQNVSNAITKTLEYAGRFIGATAKPLFKLSTDYNFARMSAQERISLVDEWQKGAISFNEMRGELKKVGIVLDENYTYDKPVLEDNK